MSRKKVHNILKIYTNKLVSSIFSGNYRAKFLGKGMEFEGYREYDYSSDASLIDTLVSEREGVLLTKVYREERELDVYFVSDLDKSFYTDMLGIKKIDTVSEFIGLMGASAVKSGDRVGLYNQSSKKLLYPKKGKSQLEEIQREILLPQPITRGRLGGGIKNALVFYITSGENSLRDIKILSQKNDLVVVHVCNSFENTLEGEGIVSLRSNNDIVHINLDDQKKKKKYVSLRKKKLSEFRKQVSKYKSRYLYLDEKKDVYSELLTFMQLKK